MSDVKVSPSIMCCKVEEISKYIQLFEKVKLDSIHFDVMDGHYVDNVMLGSNLYTDIKRLSKLPVDIHFMCMRPEKFIQIFNIKAGDRISFHPETTFQPYKLLQTIKEKKCKAGLVINPGTPVSYLQECIGMVDYVTIMTVNPGFSGQSMVPAAQDKIRRIRKMLDDHKRENIDVVVDGNTTIEHAKMMKSAGANTFVVGTSSVIKGLDKFEEEYFVYKKELEVI